MQTGTPVTPIFYSSPQQTVTPGNLLKQSGSRSFFRLGNQLITLEKYGSVKNSRYVLLSLHNNEADLIRTTMGFAREHDVFFVRLLNDGKQKFNVDLLDKNISFDPAVIFSSNGVKGVLKPYQCYNKLMLQQFQKFSRFIMAEIPDNKVIVSVNIKDNQLNIKDYASGGKLQQHAKAVHRCADMNEQNYFITMEEDIYQLLKDKNVNVVLRKKSRVKDDGSLIYHCDRVKRQFIQMEAGADQQLEQQRMLNAVDEIFAPGKK